MTRIDCATLHFDLQQISRLATCHLWIRPRKHPPETELVDLLKNVTNTEPFHCI